MPSREAFLGYSESLVGGSRGSDNVELTKFNGTFMVIIPLFLPY